MTDGIKVSIRSPEGYPVPDDVSVDVTYTGDDADIDPTTLNTADQWKQPVRCASTGDVNIAAGLNAGDTIDTVTLAAGDRVLLKDQAAPEENGLYVAGVTPVRAGDMDDGSEVPGAVVYVIDGADNAGTVWGVTTAAEPTVDTDPIAWAEVGGGTPGGGGDPSGQFIVGFDGGLSLLVAGHVQDVIAPYTGTLSRWTILGETAGSAALDVATATYAGFPSFSSVVAAAPPTLTAAIKAQSSTLTGWTTAVTAGDVLRFTLSSVSGLQRLLLVLDYTRP